MLVRMFKNPLAHVCVPCCLFFAIILLLPKLTLAQSNSVNFSPKAILVNLDPIENGKTMMTEFWSHLFPGKTPGQAAKEAAQANIDAFKRLSNDSINYQVVKQITVTSFPKYLNGFNYSFAKYREWDCNGSDPTGNCEKQKWQVDYVSFIKDNHICRIAEENNVDEIWISSPTFTLAYESFMIGPENGFWVNGPFYKVDDCNKNYIVMTSEFGPRPFTHIYAHRIESTMTFITENWNSGDRQKYWENFSIICQLPMGTTSTPCATTYCGYGHIPSNAQGQYDYANKNYKNSSCIDWKNFPNFKGEKENLNCDKWNCTDTNPGGWEEFWFGSLPRSDGEIDMVSRYNTSFKMKKNWWYYLLYPANAIEFKNSQHASARPTPTIIPSQTVSATPTNPIQPTITNITCSKRGNGDSDCNDIINLADFNIWRGEYYNLSRSQNDVKYRSDFNSDGNITLSDFNLWRTNYFKQ